MATRGCVGIVQEDGTWRGVYNHWDSYPTGLGIWVQKKLIQEVKKGKTLKQICKEILQYTGWKEYCNDGICPYCGKKGDPYSIWGLLEIGLDKLESKKVKTEEEQEVYQNLKAVGYPDPHRKWHEHVREPMEPPERYHITKESVDSYDIEYIYLIDPTKETLTVVDTYSSKEVVIPIDKLLKRKVDWGKVGEQLS